MRLYGILLLILVGCSAYKENDIKIFYSDFIIKLSIPSEAQFEYDREDGSVSYGTSKTASRNNNDLDYYLVIDDKNVSSCDPNRIAASTLKKVESSSMTLHFGKPENYELNAYGAEDFNCNPFPRARGEEITDVSYMLCSEYNQKVAVVCLMLHQDNQALAKDIFSSFRWVGAEEETEQLLKEVGL